MAGDRQIQGRHHSTGSSVPPTRNSGGVGDLGEYISIHKARGETKLSVWVGMVGRRASKIFFSGNGALSKKKDL